MKNEKTNVMTLEEWLQAAERSNRYDLNPISWDFLDEYGTTIEDGENISDRFYDMMDSKVDIYNDDLMAWLSDTWQNVEALERVVNEYGTNGSFSLYDSIRMAQSETYLEELYQDEDDINEILTKYREYLEVMNQNQAAT